MKKYILIVTLFFAFMGASFAQGFDRQISPEAREQLMSQRVAFFTDELSLTSKEAEKFWPLFNAFTKSKEELIRSSKIHPRDLEGKSDAELKTILKNHLANKQKGLDLEKKFLADLQGVLPISKIVKIPHTERAFKKEIIRKLRHR